MDKYLLNFFRFRAFNRLALHHTNYKKTNFVTTNIIKNEEAFDYVIVGGGSAGCVLASRLSEDPKNKVLLLEAGPVDNHLFIYIPAAFIKLFESPYTFNYYSEPQKNANNTRIFIPQGNVLGGSSSVNAMAYVRGSAYDYDSWGYQKWNYDSCLKYFKKSENQQSKRGEINPEFHGYDGPWKIGDVQNPHPLTQMVIRAINEEMGLPLKNDFTNDKWQQEGIGLIQVSIAGGKRQSISEAYLNKDVLKRENLFVRVDQKVTKVLMEGKRAQAVEVFEGKNSRNSNRIWANKEVILSAGTFHSPKLLMLSGIGQKEMLNSKGINCVMDLPEVGKNLQDHPIFSYIKYLKKPISLDVLNKFPQNAISLFGWLWSKDNELSNAAELAGYFRSNIAKKNDEKVPDVHIIFIKCLYIDHGKKSESGRYGYSLGTMLLKPKSLGSVSIRSSDFSDSPVIDLGIFNDEDDFNRLYDGTKTLRKVIEGKTLSQINHDDYFVPTKQGLENDEVFKKEIRSNAQTLYHPTSTCSMGKVVDENLKVFGVDGLRVVDGSIFPGIVRANTNAPVVMVAEHAADIIKGGR